MLPKSINQRLWWFNWDEFFHKIMFIMRHFYQAIIFVIDMHPSKSHSELQVLLPGKCGPYLFKPLFIFIILYFNFIKRFLQKDLCFQETSKILHAFLSFTHICLDWLTVNANEMEPTFPHSFSLFWNYRFDPWSKKYYFNPKTQSLSLKGDVHSISLALLSVKACMCKF